MARATSRGLYTWNEAALVDAVFDQVKKDSEMEQPKDRSSRPR
ncbi:hypothetical protein STANM309S_03099 [Streptomyces tanashiensis]